MPAPTKEELELIAEIMTLTNTEESRVLSTEAAIDIFERSDLSRKDLREIWRLADKDRNGMLSSRELVVALRLIGWVQAGKELEPHLVNLREFVPVLLEGVVADSWRSWAMSDTERHIRCKEAIDSWHHSPDQVDHPAIRQARTDELH